MDRPIADEIESREVISRRGDAVPAAGATEGTRRTRRSVVQVAVLGLLVWVCVGLLQWVQYRATTDQLTEAVGRRAMKIAQMVVLSLEPYRSAYLALDYERPASREDPDYQRLLRHVRAIQSQFEDVRYVYTEKIFPARGYLVYLLDATPPEREDFSPLGEKDYDLQDSIYRTTRPDYDRHLHHYERWGALLTGWAPVFDDQGKVHSYASVDIDANQLAHELSAVRRSALLTFTGVSVVIGLCAWLMAIAVQRRTAQFDATERSADHFRRLALHDNLTALPNRSQVMQYLESLIAVSADPQWPTYVLYVDLDGFKDINDRYGHATGDQVLIAATRRMTANVRSTDFVARLSGDEFLVVLAAVESESAAIRIAQTLVQSLAATVQVQGVALSVTASIGVAQYPRDGSTVDEVLRAADAAMYAAKRAGKNNYRVAGPA